jgi:glutaredoxin
MISYELKQKGVNKDTAKITLAQAKDDLKTAKEYIEKRLGENATVDQLEAAAPGVKELPAVFIDGIYVGGLRELQSHLRNP